MEPFKKLPLNDYIVLISKYMSEEEIVDYIMALKEEEEQKALHRQK